MSRSYLTLRVGIITTFLFLCLNVFSQSATPGLIIKPAESPGNTVLDPDGDGYVSQKTSGVQVGFVNPPNNDVTQSELPYVAIVRPDPIGDILRGPQGGFIEIVGVDVAGNDAILIYNDGTNLLVRFRLGGYAPNSKSYSLLIDTDQKFGFSGANADPNAVDGNLGFEAEIVLQTNFNVKAFNVDGTDNAVEVASFDYDTHCQKAVALSTAGDNPDYFYDFYLPLSSLSSLFEEKTPLRIVAITVMNPHEAIGNNALSDVGGVTDGSDIDAIFEELIEEQTPTPPGEEVLDRSACPSINAPIKTDNVTVSGTSTEADGTSITVDVYEADDSFIGSSSTTVLDGEWSVDMASFSGLSLVAGQYFQATATADNKGESYDDCSKRSVVDAGAPACSAPIPESLFLAPNAKTNTVTYNASSEVAGYKLQLYNVSDNTVRATDPASYVTDGRLSYAFSGLSSSDRLNDTYLLITDESGSCSPYIMNICSGGTYLSVPIITQPVAAGSNVTISGTCQVGSVIDVIVNDVSIGTAGVVDTTWTIQASLNADDVVYVVASHASYCSINSTSITAACEPSSTPTISSGIIAGDTQIAGISGVDAVIEVFKNTVSLGVTTAVGTAWTMTGITLFENDEVYAVATEAGKCEAYSINVTAASTPAINIDANFCGSTNLVSGTIAATGGNVQVWRVGTPDALHGSSVVISNSGAWSASVPTLSDGDQFYVVATLTNGAVATSTTESISAQTTNTAIISSIPIIEQTTILSGTGTIGETITLYVDGAELGYSTIVDGVGEWTMSGIASYDLYIGADVVVTSKATGQCESDFSASNTVQCNMPAEAVYTGGDYTYCLGSSGVMPLPISTSGVIYQFVDALGVAQGPATVGTGGATSISTYALWSDLNDLFVKAYKIGYPACSSVSSTVVNFTPAGPIPTVDFTTTSLSVEKGSATVNLPYTAKSTSPSADTYTIDYTVDANSQGFIDISSPVSISSATGNIVLSVPVTAEEGTYNATLRIAETLGSSCYSYYDIAITVYSTSGAPVISTQPVSASICENNSISVSVEAFNVTSYQWQSASNFSGPYSDIVGATSPDYTSANLTDTIYYRAQVANANDTVYSDIASVNVNPYPLRPMIMAGGFITFFAGDSVVLTSSDASSYQWYKEGVAIPFEINKTYTAKTSGNYTVIVKNSSLCASVVSNTILVSVSASNVYPIATDDSRVIDEDNSIRIAVLSNDNDADGSITDLDTMGVALALHGNVLFAGDTIVYTPDENYYGSDSLQYVITDDEGAMDTAWVVIIINSVNDAPSKGDEHVHSYEDVEFDTENVLLNNVDIDGYVVLGDSATMQGGAFSYNPLDSTFHYIPVLNYFGHDTIIYTVCDEDGACVNDSVFITIESINDFPIAINDNSSTLEDETVIIPVIDANDTDSDGVIINLSVSGVSQAEHGTVYLHGDSLDYVPDADFFGLDSFQYVITDDADDKDTAWVFVAVISVNDVPSQGNEFSHSYENVAFNTDNVLLNNTDVEGGLIVSDSATMQGGTIVYNILDNTFYYTPVANYFGHDTIIYQVCDGDGACVNDSIFITIESVNNFPVAMNDSSNIQEDEVVAIPVIDNDTDVDGTIVNLTIAGVSQANHGAVQLNGYIIEYSPDSDFFGFDSLQYVITDDSGDKDTAWVFLSVVSVNDAPDQGNEYVHAFEDVAFDTENVLLNNMDVDGTVELSDSIALQGGTISYNPLDSSFHYVPTPNYFGHDTIVYMVCDDSLACVYDSIFITIEAVNDFPVAVNDFVNTLEDELIIIPVVRANDTDSDGAITDLSLFGVSQATHGTAYLHGDSIEYIPDADFFGLDSLQYVITDNTGDKDTAWVFVTVISVNDVLSQGNEYVHAFEDVAFDTENVLLNNTDVDGVVELSDSTTKQGGMIVYNNLDSSFHYTPVSNYFGHDTIIYQVCDDSLACVLDSVFITIESVNDFPVAMNDSSNLQEDEDIAISVINNDTDVDGAIVNLTIAGVSQANHGTVQLNGYLIEYSSDSDFFGFDSLQYVITDDSGDKDTAWVFLSVVSVNDAPSQGNEYVHAFEDVAFDTENVLLNNMDVDGTVELSDSITKQGGMIVYNNLDSSFHYTPVSNYFGHDTIIYQVCDDSLACVLDSVFITIESVNDFPVAVDDSSNVQEDGVVVISVLDNDTDVDGTIINLTIAGVRQANHGTVSVTGDTISYLPNTNYFGDDSLQYVITDDNGDKDTAWVFIAVASVNDMPNQGNELLILDEDASVKTSNVLSNNLDLDGTVSVTNSSAKHGSVIYNSADSTFTYEPNSNYFGKDTIFYTVCDDSTACVYDSVFVSIHSVNDSPLQGNELVTVDEDMSVKTPNALDNNTDIDGTVSVVASSASYGTVVYQPVDSTFIYNPEANFFGRDTIIYTVCDDALACVFDSVFVTVNGVNDFPSQGNEYEHTGKNVEYDTENVLLNNVDIDGFVTLSDSSTTQGGEIRYNSGDSTFHYTPLSNYTGNDTIVYTVCDDSMACVSDTVFVTIGGNNLSPIAINDTDTTKEDVSVIIPIIDNDSDSDGIIVDISVLGLSQAQHGAAYLQDDSIVYTPDDNYFGADSLQYVIADDNGEKDTAWVIITIVSVNDAPSQGNELLILDEDASVKTSNVLVNNLDIDGTVSIADSSASHGSVSYNPIDSTFTYSPDSNYFGDDTILYTVCDDSAACVFDSVFVSINPLNDAPLQGNESLVLDEDVAKKTINVLVNNTDVDGTVSIITSSANHGTLVYNSGDSTFTYSPQLHYFGTDTIFYTVCDNDLICVFDSIFVTIASVNDAPSQGNEYVHAFEDLPFFTDNVLLNNVDVDGSLTVRDSSTTQGGLVVYNSADSTFHYTPAANYTGYDTLLYTVCDDSSACVMDSVFITITNVNDAPIAVNDSFDINEDEAVIVPVIINDTDSDGTIVDVSLLGVSQANHGTVNVTGNSISYTSDANYFGADSLQYVITDDFGDKDTAWVFFSIASVNDAPSQGNEYVHAFEDLPFFTDNVLLNNLDLDGLVTVRDSSTTQGGVIIYNSADSTFHYTPAANYTGHDTLLYTVCDDSSVCVMDSVFITINDVNDAPIAANDSVYLNEDESVIVPITTNDTDLDGTIVDVSLLGVSQANHGIVNVTGGSVSYAPDANYFGADSLQYVITDDFGDKDTAWVFFSVASVNDAPSQGNEYMHAFEDLPFFTDNVLLNNVDVDGSLTVRDSSTTQGGTIVYNSVDSTFHYTPAFNYTGQDTIIYAVCDDSLACVMDSVFITITDVNDAPIAANDSVYINEDESVVVPVRINDTDLDGTIVDVSLLGESQANHGTATLTGDNISYTPDANYYGDDSLQYVITDDFGDKDTAWVFFSVASVNDAPSQGNEYVHAFEDLPFFTDNVLLNNVDVDGSLTVRDSSTTQGGTIVYNSADSTFHYTPAFNYTGHDTILYTVCDDSLACVSDSIFITITDVNDSPVAVNDYPLAINEDESIIVPITVNDTDSDGAIVNVVTLGVIQASHGIVYSTGDSIEYIPDANYFGKDSLQYVIIDDVGDKDTAWVFISIVSVNDVPSQGNEYVHAHEDVAFITENVLQNNTDVDGVVELTHSGTTQGGLIVYNPADSTFHYTPVENYVGMDTIVYTVCDDSSACVNDSVFVNVERVNDSPVALNDSAITLEDVSIVIPAVHTNDTDSDGTIVAVSILGVSQANHGQVELNGLDVTYIPNANFYGSDSLQYVVTDDSGDKDTAWVFVFVVSVNDGPTSGDEYETMREDMSLVTKNVLDNNSDLDGEVTVTSFSANHGTISYNPVDSTFSYTPRDNYFGQDTIIYTVCDDSLVCVSDSVFVTIIAVNDAPLSGNETLKIDEDASAKTPNVLLNNPDVDGFVELNHPMTTQLGTVVYDPSDSTFLYTAPPNFYGVDTVIYQVCDNGGACVNDSIFVEIVAINDVPISGNEEMSTGEDMPAISPNVLNNNVDVDGAVSIGTYVTTQGGIVVYNLEDSTFTYTPVADFNGVDTIIYSVCDAADVCVSDSLFVTVISIGDVPVANDDLLIVSEIVGASVTMYGIADNDSDVDGNLDATSIRLVDDEAGIELDSLYVEGEGMWRLNQQQGSVTFTPDDDFFGDPTPIPYVIYDYDHFRSSMAFLEIIFTRYDVIYNGNGTSVNVPFDDKTYMEGDSVFIQNMIPERDGYSFEGWEVNIDGEVLVYLPGDTVIMIGAHIEFVARWVQLDPTKAFIPDVFTPNGDGNHDFFVIPWIADIGYSVMFKVYNRWGDEVFVDHNYNNDWNGESNGRLSLGNVLPDGTYFYVIEVNSPEKEKRQGYVYIKR